MKAWKHFLTISRHKYYVTKMCLEVGLVYQGLVHDLSKYGPTEFCLGCKYYQGDESPHNGERREYGYSLGWLHHKGRNMHHFEYWTDYGKDKMKGIVGIKMPKKYVVEMFLDRIGASKNYEKENYTDAKPWEYYERQKAWVIIHPETRKLLEKLLLILKNKGKERTFLYVKNRVLKDDYPY